MASILSDIFGSKPKVPTLPTITLPQQQGQSIAANQAALPGEEQLASSANTFTQQQLENMLNFSVPGWSNIASAASTDISSEVSGEIPKDVQQQIQDSAAAQSLAGGFGGSELAGNLVARDLGLTSLQLTNQGLSSAESWMKASASVFEPGQVNVASAFISPEQQYQATNQQNQQQWQRQWLQNQISAMPDPTTVGLWNTGWSIFDSALSAYTGGDFSGMGTVSPQGTNYGDLSNSFGGGAGGGTGMEGFDTGAGQGTYDLPDVSTMAA